MNFSETFIRRPIATSLLMAGLALFGFMAYRALPVSDLPTVDFPTLTVSASLPGADPATMASAVATPLERQFTTIAGVDSMTSTNSQGSSQITLQFDLDRKIEGAAVDVQTAIAAAMPLLPPGMPAPPSFRKVNPADSPILFLTLTSKTLPFNKVDEYAETTIAQRLSMIPGVAQVNVMGAQKYAVRVKVNPDRLASRGIGFNQIAQALQGWNVNQPVGTIWGDQSAMNIQANGQLMNANDFAQQIIAYRNNAPIRLRDIATVVDSVEEERTASYLYQDHGKSKIRIVTLMVMRQPGSNIIEVNDAIKKVLPQIQAQLPPSVILGLRSDRSKNIREAFNDVQFTMTVTIALVILVIALFLRNASATVIPSLALPFSILGTLSVIYLLGFSLNNISMMALILSIGFIVDDAIVMLENIVRHVEGGEDPKLAAVRGSREIWFTILSMTISLAAVFIPILFMGGILGRLFREFAVSICVAVLISGFVSISLTPMLCSRVLRAPRHDRRPNALSRGIEAVFQANFRMYSRTLHWAVRHSPLMIGVFFAIVIATGFLYTQVQKGFIPDIDADQLFVNTEVAQGTAFPLMLTLQERIANVLSQDPDIEGFFGSVGGGNWGSSTNGRMFVNLKPRKERKASAEQIANRLRPKLQGFPGIRAVISLPPSIRVGGRGSRAAYEFTLQATDTDRLYKESAIFERKVAALPMVQEVNSDLQIRTPRLTVDVDRDKAAAFGLDFQQIESALYSAYGPNWASTIYAPQNQFRVMLEVEDRYQAYGDMLSHLYFANPDGKLIPLSSVSKIKQDAGPQSINHTGQLPSVTISFNLKPNISLGEAVNAVQNLAHRELPGAIHTNFSGTAKAFQDSLRNMSLLLLIAVAVVYIVLGVLYESFIHPITILSGLPAAGFGALLTLLIFHVELNMYTFVGLVMLIGIVKKNAIMQIDFALESERKHGKPPEEAIVEGCLIRFRPIMMTTLAALFGSLPIALGYGAGGEARRPLGMAVVGGLVFSQMLTLYLTPIIYIYMARLTRRLTHRTTRELTPALPAVSEVQA